MNVKDEEFKTIAGFESYGTRGMMAMRVQIAASSPFDSEDKGLRNAAWAAQQAIESALQAAIIRANPQDLANAAEERASLLACFGAGGPIYVEEIPNGYCTSGCCTHRPWFIVTTPIGHFTIGWRKRVINIDWSKTTCKWDGHTLFPGEDVTRGKDYIHAWSYAKATDYLRRLHEAGPKPANADDD